MTLIITVKFYGNDTLEIVLAAAAGFSLLLSVLGAEKK